jgi:DNA-binding response OmpR family regulator
MSDLPLRYMHESRSRTGHILTFDIGTLTFCVDGVPVEGLVIGEKELLLVLHMCKVFVGREKLLELVYDDPEVVCDRAIDTMVRRIRAKLKETVPGSETLIKALPRVGYMV